MLKDTESIINERIWKNGKFRIFLSHKAEYKVQTAKLQEDLSFRYGISSFVAHNDIESTRHWQDEIENALDTMDLLVALMTDGFHDSNWTDQEIGYALGSKKPVIAVRMGTDPYGFIGKYQAISSNWDNLAFDIIKPLMKHPKMVDLFIDMMSQCGSFARGNQLADYLKYIDSLTTEQINEMIKVFNSNGELQGSFDFSSTEHGLIDCLNKLSETKYKLDDDYKIREVVDE